MGMPRQGAGVTALYKRLIRCATRHARECFIAPSCARTRSVCSQYLPEDALKAHHLSLEPHLLLLEPPLLSLSPPRRGLLFGCFPASSHLLEPHANPASLHRIDVGVQDRSVVNCRGRVLVLLDPRGERQVRPGQVREDRGWSWEPIRWPTRQGSLRQQSAHRRGDRAHSVRYEGRR